MLSPSPSPKVQKHVTQAFSLCVSFPPAENKNVVKSLSQGPGSQRGRNGQNPSCAVTSAVSSLPVMSSLVKYWLIWLSWVVEDNSVFKDSSVCAEEREWNESQWEQPSEQDCVCCDLIPLTLHTHTHTPSSARWVLLTGSTPFLYHYQSSTLLEHSTPQFTCMGLHVRSQTPPFQHGLLPGSRERRRAQECPRAMGIGFATLKFTQPCAHVSWQHFLLAQMHRAFSV